jgi:hypothetical protein
VLGRKNYDTSRSDREWNFGAASHHGPVAFRGRERWLGAVSPLILAAPFFLVFEIWQLVLSERYLGMKQIARGVDPRTLGLHEVTAFFWSTILIAYWFWMLLLLFTHEGRMQGGGLLLIWMLGFSLRRGARFKWILMILTFEGAIRIGLLLVLSLVAWKKYM